MESTDSLFFLTGNIMAPLFIYILMGYIGGKVLKLERETVANLLFYMINPIAIFHNLAHTKVDHALLLIPIMFYALACLICISFYFFAKKLWKNELKNILAFSAGAGNVGYLLFPIVLTVFGQNYIAPFFLIVVGISLYENTLGFYISAAGKYTAHDSLMKLLKLPTLYAFIFGIIFSHFEVSIPSFCSTFTYNVSGMYTVVGMMMIGLSLAPVKRLEIDFKFLGMAALARYVVWPVAMFILITIDKNITHLYSNDLHKLFMISVFIPMAVTSLVLATILKIQPEKVALSVMITTVAAIIYVPLIIKFIM